MQRHDERLEVGGSQELDLVEKEDDAHPVLGRGVADRDEQVTQVLGQSAAVGRAGQRVDVEARGHAAVGTEGERERLEDGRGSERPLRPARLGRELQQGAAHLGRHLGGEGGVLFDFPLDRRPVARLGLVAEHVEQHRLTDAAQPGDDLRLCRVAALESLEQDVEGLDLLVAADERRRLGAGAGGVGVLARVHRPSSCRTLQTRRNLSL